MARAYAVSSLADSVITFLRILLLPYYFICISYERSERDCASIMKGTPGDTKFLSGGLTESFN